MIVDDVICSQRINLAGGFRVVRIRRVGETIFDLAVVDANPVVVFGSLPGAVLRIGKQVGLREILNRVAFGVINGEQALRGLSQREPREAGNRCRAVQLEGVRDVVVAIVDEQFIFDEAIGVPIRLRRFAERRRRATGTSDVTHATLPDTRLAPPASH